MKKTAFTLVELIVVITILAILATIGFVSFSGYLGGTRDTNRIAQLKSMSDALELYRTKKDLPIPDDKVDVQASGTTIAYQGYIGANVLETIEYTEKGLDPKDKNYFSYYLTKDKKYFQLLTFLEEPSADTLAGYPQGVSLQNNIVGLPFMGNLNAVDYSNRYPHSKGKKLGILTDTDKTPIQDISTITSSGYLDVVNTTDTFISHLTDEIQITGSGTTLMPLGLSVLNGKEYKSCKEILENEPLALSGSTNYYIRPEGYPLFEIYCDMDNEGGGWTRYVEIRGNYTFQDAIDCADRLERIDNDTLYCFYPYKMGSFTEFKYIDNTDSQIYKTVVDKGRVDPNPDFEGIHNTTLFDSNFWKAQPEVKLVWFGLNLAHHHSECGDNRHPGGITNNPVGIPGIYMNYDRDATGTLDCSGPSSAGQNRENDAREGEFYVR